MSHEKYEDYQDCIAACHACVVACNHCAASCLQEPHVGELVTCIGLDTDCAQACQLAIAFMSGGSDHVAAVCRMCAEVCRACAAECAQHDMDHCQQCAEACKRCAEECRKLAG
ncbi:MAG: four-helix bundle copper-binding protein [Burkholderiales bacterium]|nr:four-helix bundle copper-binding protein [Burkholderiales bacterium]